MKILGIDVGGSGIKGALVDLESGELTAERIRFKTPSSSEIEKVTKTIASLVREFDYSGLIGVGFPAAVAEGIVLTARTAHSVEGWVGQFVNERFANAIGPDISKDVSVIHPTDLCWLSSGTVNHSTPSN